MLLAEKTWLTMSFPEIVEQPKNVFTLGLNQPGRIFEAAVAHCEDFICDTGLVVAIKIASNAPSKNGKVVVFPPLPGHYSFSGSVPETRCIFL
jgi:hypothetical protein